MVNIRRHRDAFKTPATTAPHGNLPFDARETDYSPNDVYPSIIKRPTKEKQGKKEKAWF